MAAATSTRRSRSRGITDTVTKVEIEMYVTGFDASMDAALLSPIYDGGSGPFAYLFTVNDLSGSDLGTSCATTDQTRF